MSEIKFGTDGWRALMTKDFTYENVERLAQAFSDYAVKALVDGTEKKSPRIVIGYDYRKDSEKYAETFAQVLLGNNISITLSDQAVPTPTVSYAVVHGKYDAGIMVTASHNPGEYNGIKIKDRNGSSADPSVTKAVEECIDQSEVKKANPGGVEEYRENVMHHYIEHIKSYLHLDWFKNKSFKILVDSMHGVGADHISQILKGTSIEVSNLRSNRDITFGGVSPEPIPKNFPQTLEMMNNGSFDVAFVTDGDADRIGAARPGGRFISPGTLLTLIMLHLVEDLGKKGEVVTTVSNTALIERVAKDLGLKTHVTKVGFKYVADIMRHSTVLIAGEESGGIAIGDYLMERDGIFSALMVLQMMQCRKMTLDEILKSIETKYGEFLYARQDLEYPDHAKSKCMASLKDLEVQEIEGVPVARKVTLDGVKFVFENDAWLLFRMSGTEPLLRIYSESQVQGQAERLVEWGKNLTLSFV